MPTTVNPVQLHQHSTSTWSYLDADVSTGEPGSHAEAKEILAGFTGAFVDREAETRGMDMYDRERAKRSAQEQAEQGLSQNSNW